MVPQIKYINFQDKLTYFNNLKYEEYIYCAGRDWLGITDEMRIETFKKLKNEEWIYQAGRNWSGITNEMRIETFKN